MICGIRGATTVDKDEKIEIITAVKELLITILTKNNVTSSQVIAVFFTNTPDLKSVFPASAARDLGWTDVPLLDGQQPIVEGSLKQCIRVMLLCEKETPGKVKHIYLKKARELRPDLLENS